MAGATRFRSNGSNYKRSITMKTIFAGAVEMWPTDRLKPHPGNARTHSQEQIAQLVASFERYGVTHPFLADENDNILAGHGKHLAALQMGLEEVPVIVLRGLTESA
jgi:ParB-like chromosome segregation protein Spo0J